MDDLTLDERNLLRLDRLATLCVFRPLARCRNGRFNGVPILMYHSVSRRNESSRAGYYSVCTDPRVFDRQMRWLAENGYRGVSLREAVSVLGQQREGFQKTVGLTFDDGYKDFYEEAYPVLRKYGFNATAFLITDRTGFETRSFGGRPCLTWQEVTELHQHGVEFGSHTVTHRKLDTLTNAEISRELTASKTEIEDRLGSDVESFAYPYAFPAPRMRFRTTLGKMLERCRYRFGVTTTIGTVSPQDCPLFLKRLPVNSFDDDRLFQAKIEGAYNWLRSVQFVKKLVRRQ